MKRTRRLLLLAFAIAIAQSASSARAERADDAPAEHRAFWCHSAFGVDGMTWDQAIKNLADNGFNAILPET